jgi:hypothetical protein
MRAKGSKMNPLNKGQTFTLLMACAAQKVYRGMRLTKAAKAFTYKDIELSYLDGKVFLDVRMPGSNCFIVSSSGTSEQEAWQNALNFLSMQTPFDESVYLRLFSLMREN